MTDESHIKTKRISKKSTGKITIDDIAFSVGVSTATISRALNKPESVSLKLREKINQTIKSIGYIPSGAARALASNRSYTVGAIVPTMKNAIFAASLASFEEQLSKHNYTMLVTVSNYDQVQETNQLQKLLERGVDAVLLVGLNHSADTWTLIENSNCCVIAIWGNSLDSKVPCIGFDNQASSELIVEHLQQLGHKRIAMIAGITKGNDRAAARMRGVKLAMKRLGLEVNKSLFVEKRYSMEAGREGFDELMDQQSRPTAIVCGNDVLAIGAMSQAREKSISVPEQVSIVGFDNLPITEYVWPKLTTIDVPSEQIGLLSAQSIIDFLASGNPIQSKMLETTLLVRGTTGAAQ